jgi:hypothetical protein
MQIIRKGGLKVKKLSLAALMFVLLFAYGAQNADAQDGILFPFFSSGGGDMTFIQVINTQATSPTTAQGKLAYTYVYNTKTETCQHFDDKGNTSLNDIFLYEVTGQIAGQLLPGDTTSTSAVLTVSPATGFLVINQDTGFATGTGEGTLFGQAFVVNVNSGTVFAYNAINDPNETDFFAFWEEADWEHYLTFMPTTIATTTYLFFPIYNYDLTVDGNQFFDAVVRIGDDNDGVFNNNESLKSGAKDIPVGCWDENPATGDAGRFAFFFFGLDQIMSGAQFAAVKGTGGWTNDDYYSDDCAFGNCSAYGYTYKIMSSNVLGKPMATLLYEPGEHDFYLSYTK